MPRPRGGNFNSDVLLTDNAERLDADGTKYCELANSPSLSVQLYGLQDVDLHFTNPV